jgi:MFS superfamily sulfate permease-like transporter
MKNNNTNNNDFQMLKSFWKNDIISGFMVFLLALPLSLGIAKASGFPPAMGVVSAIIGGLATIFFKVSPLTIKGPAAGLITICAAAITEFGNNEMALQTVSTVIVVMAILQISSGFLKLGRYTDFFPPAAIHAMLAAIGIIIILKQIPVLLGDEPQMYKGEGPIELFLDIPQFLLNAHFPIALVGFIALIILFVLPKFNISILKFVPAPLIVLIITIPLSIIWHFKETQPSYSLVQIGNFWDSIHVNLNFDLIATFGFWKYVLMFYFVSSLESLLTVKAVDGLDAEKRISNPNGDLVGQGFGNFFAGLVGGLPIISEVVRSSANVKFKAKSIWSNFFHGLFLLLAMLFFIPVIELIPNAALAALLIYAGYNLAAPKHFIHAYKIGKEQLLIFVITILITLIEDLLLGILAGIITKFIIEISHGVNIKHLFKAVYKAEIKEDKLYLEIQESAIFSNLIGFKKIIYKQLKTGKVVLDFSKTKFIDHSFMTYLIYLQNEFDNEKIKVKGIENLQPFTNHPESARKLKK